MCDAAKALLLAESIAVLADFQRSRQVAKQAGRGSEGRKPDSGSAAGPWAARPIDRTGGLDAFGAFA